MEKHQPKLNSSIRAQFSLIVIGTLLFNQAPLAQSKIVVIPLFGDDIPAISDPIADPHPVVDPFTNSIGMTFNELPAGSFTMGSPTSELGRRTDEVEHRVTLSKPFKMQITEVTNAQWNDVIVDSSFGVNPSRSNPGDNTYPVDSVSWYDAAFFANRLSLSENRSVCYTFSGLTGTPGNFFFNITTVTQNAGCTGYRLPTEAEWEYAARAGTTTAYANSTGFDDSDTEMGVGFNGNLNAMGWYYYNRDMENGSAVAGYPDGTKPVAKKQANAWGLYDMHGNVREWNWDRYQAYSGNVTDPTGAASGLTRIIRGGGWDRHARNARSAERFDQSPSHRDVSLGFRLILPQNQ